MGVELREHAGWGPAYEAGAGTCASTAGVQVIRIHMSSFVSMCVHLHLGVAACEMGHLHAMRVQLLGLEAGGLYVSVYVVHGSNQGILVASWISVTQVHCTVAYQHA